MDALNPILDPLRVIWEGEIDFKGQTLVETLSTSLLTLTGLLAFLAGFTTQNIYNTLYIGLGGTALTFLVCVPPWPWYNSAPLPFLPAREGGRAGVGGGSGSGGGGGGQYGSIVVDGKRIS